MKLIVGLGNPGEKYINTRHNLGFKIVEHFLKDFQSAKNTLWEDSKKFKSEISQIEWQPRRGVLEKVILAKPQTYMNNSGLAVKIIADFYKIPTENIWIVHDDIDLPLGSMKIRFGGASAGHHGVESIMGALTTDKFWRFRMGIGNKNSEFRIHNSESKSRKTRNVEDYVLGEFRGGEKGQVRKLVKRGTKAIEVALEENLESAMNRFNTK